MTKNIFLIGFMGAGKSTIAGALEKKLDITRVEMDEIIAQREGKSISSIFEENGEEYFRNLETEFLKETKDSETSVISCGGGVAMRPENVSIMKQNGITILLMADPATILERVKDDTSRPLLNGHMNVEYITELMDKRMDAYKNAADHIVRTDGRSADDICDEIISIFCET